MVYNRGEGRQPYQRISGSGGPQGNAPEPPEDVVQLIARIAAKSPGLGAAAIHEEVRRHRNDVSAATVRKVMQDLAHRHS